MGGVNIPLPALGGQIQKPQSLLDSYAKLQAINSSKQQQELQSQEIEQNKLHMAQVQAMNDAYKGAFTADANGAPTFDRNKMYQSVSAAGQGSLIPQLTKSFQDLDKTAGDIQKTKDEHVSAQQDYMGAWAAAAKQSKYDPTVMGGLLARAHADGYDKEAQQFMQVVQQNPDAMPKIIDQMIQQSPKQRELAVKEATEQNAATREADTVKRDAETARHNDAMENRVPVTEAGLAAKAASGDATAEAALNRLDKSKIASRPVNNIMTGTDAKDIADAIQHGDQPPTLQGLYRNAGPVRAELARRGVPLAQMETDWKATQKYMSTLNGSQQVRVRQAIDNASESIDKIEGLYNEWQKLAPTSGFKVLNKAALVASKNVSGRTGAVATALEAQIADVTSELGNVYMGGNSPTDHSLSLAGKNLSADWNNETFKEALKQTRLNLKIRQNSITHGGPAGASNSNTYFQKQADQAPASGSMKITLPSGKQITID